MKSLIKKQLLLLFTMTSIGFAQESQFNKLDEFLDILEKNNKLMATLTITKDSEDVYNKALGFMDVASQKENGENTKFRIGSITKAFTAVMIFQLIDENKLTLETPLSKFFPQVPNASKIKIANLLNHSSGLFNITNADDVGEWIYKPSTQKLMVSRITTFENDFQPGTETSYSNTNYILLGYIAESLDKKPYADILKERIVNTLDLKNTYYGRAIGEKVNESYSYYIENDTWQKQRETNMTNPGGAGAIVSTSKDLALFMNGLFSNKLISEKSLEAMKKTNNGDVCHGIFYANMKGMDLYASEGGIDGFQSMLAHIPATKTTIALTANGLDFSKMRIMLSAFAASHGQPIMLPKFNKIELTEAEVKQYEGEYACDEVPYKLIFKADGTTLMGAPEQSNLKALTSVKQHQFMYDNLGIVLDFYPETGLVRFTQGEEKPLLFKKL